MAAEIPGVELARDQPTPALQDGQDTYNDEDTPQQQEQHANEAIQNTDFDHLPAAIPAEPDIIEPAQDDDDKVQAVNQIPDAPEEQEPIEIPDDNESEDGNDVDDQA